MIGATKPSCFVDPRPFHSDQGSNSADVQHFGPIPSRLRDSGNAGLLVRKMFRTQKEAEMGCRWLQNVHGCWLQCNATLHKWNFTPSRVCRLVRLSFQGSNRINIQETVVGFASPSSPLRCSSHLGEAAGACKNSSNTCLNWHSWDLLGQFLG